MGVDVLGASAAETAIDERKMKGIAAIQTIRIVKVSMKRFNNIIPYPNRLTATISVDCHKLCEARALNRSRLSATPAEGYTIQVPVPESLQRGCEWLG